VKGGKAHFLYLTQSQPPRQHYVRYDLKSGKRDLDISPRFQGSRRHKRQRIEPRTGSRFPHTR